MIRQLVSSLRARRERTVRGALVAALATSLIALWLVPAGAAPGAEESADASAQQQVLVWTAGDSLTEYVSAPETAKPGPATIVFENSTATGNTTGMTHSLTFDTSSPEHNNDVKVNIVASPYDANGGRYEVEVNLSPGTYRYYCTIPGHGQMQGVLVVTEDGGDDEDTTPPSVTAEVSGDRDGDGGYVGSATVTITASDDGSGVDTVEYALDDGDFQPYSEPVIVSEPGDHTLRYRATDHAGNTSEEGSVTFTVVEGDPNDTAPPTVSAEVAGDRDDDGSYVGSATVTITASDDGSGVDTVEYALDDGDFQPYSEPVIVSEPGDHTLRYRATDHAGNTSEEGSVTFTVVEGDPNDTAPPTVSAEVAGDRDDDGGYVGSAMVTITASDDGSGVDTVEYALDDGDFQPYSEPVIVSEPGDHTLRYRATDHAGNTSEEGSVTFTVVEADREDTTPPEVTAQVTGTMNAQWEYVDSATVTLSANDSESGVRFLRYSLDGGSYTPYGEPVVITEPGEHTVLYHAVDHAGNRSEDGKLTFTVVAAEGDACPGSDVRDTVRIAGHDSTVDNVDTGNGCTINDLLASHTGHHGDPAERATEVADQLAAEGVISEVEKRRIVLAAENARHH